MLPTDYLNANLDEESRHEVENLRASSASNEDSTSDESNLSNPAKECSALADRQPLINSSSESERPKRIDDSRGDDLNQRFLFCLMF